MTRGSQRPAAWALGALVLASSTALAQVGSLDTTFGSDGLATIAFELGGDNDDRMQTLAVQPDGRILAAGIVRAGADGGDFEFGVGRLNADGSLDGSFGTSGRAVVEFDLAGSFGDIALGIALQGDGAIVLCGWVENDGHTDVGVARLTPQGALDPTFGTGGKVVFGTILGGPLSDLIVDCVIDGEGRIVLAGVVFLTSTNADFIVARLTPAGALDTTFSGDGVTTVPFDLAGTGSDQGTALLIQPDGRIVIAGVAEDALGGFAVALARLLETGAPDSSFGGGGKVTLDLNQGGTFDDVALDVGLTADGKIVVAGYSETAAAGDDFLVARFLADGSLDPLLGGGDGWVTTGFDLGGDLDDRAGAVAFQDDGKMIVTGGVDAAGAAEGVAPPAIGGDPAVIAAVAERGSSDADFGAVRLLPDGSLDPAFGVSGRAVVPSGADPSFIGGAVDGALQADQRIVMGGNYVDAGNNDFLFARLINDPPLLIFTDGFESGDTSAWSAVSP